MERSLIEHPALSPPQRAPADFPPVAEDIGERRALETRGPRPAVLPASQPRTGCGWQEHPQERLVDFPINNLRTHRGDPGRMGNRQRNRQIMPVKNRPSTRPAPHNGKRPRGQQDIVMALGITECHRRALPPVKADDRIPGQAQESLVHRHLGGRFSRGGVLPNLQNRKHDVPRWPI